MPGHSHFWAQLRRWVGWDWVPQTPAERDRDRLKIKFRAAAGGRQQIGNTLCTHTTWHAPPSSRALQYSTCAEVKVKCPASEAKQQQLYSLEFFFFFPKELEAVRLSGFYSDLWEVVRLHPPKVDAFSGAITLLSLVEHEMRAYLTRTCPRQMTLAALSFNDERAGVSCIKALLQVSDSSQHL